MFSLFNYFYFYFYDHNLVTTAYYSDMSDTSAVLFLQTLTQACAAKPYLFQTISVLSHNLLTLRSPGLRSRRQSATNTSHLLLYCKRVPI